jgi:ketosteroid isomerase-like protein
MRRYKTVLRILACVGALAAFVSSEAAIAASTNTGPRNLTESFRKAFEARNLDAIMAVYAPGAQLFVFDALPPRAYPSAQAYRKDFEGLLRAFPGPVHDSVQEYAVTVIGPVAYAHHVQDVRLTRKNGTVWHVVIRVTDVYRKMAGRWVIVQEHVSWPVDPKTGKADFLSRP